MLYCMEQHYSHAKLRNGNVLTAFKFAGTLPCHGCLHTMESSLPLSTLVCILTGKKGKGMVLDIAPLTGAQ